MLDIFLAYPSLPKKGNLNFVLIWVRIVKFIVKGSASMQLLVAAGHLVNAREMVAYNSILLWDRDNCVQLVGGRGPEAASEGKRKAQEIGSICKRIFRDCPESTGPKVMTDYADSEKVKGYKKESGDELLKGVNNIPSKPKPSVEACVYEY